MNRTMMIVGISCLAACPEGGTAEGTGGTTGTGTSSGTSSSSGADVTGVDTTAGSSGTTGEPGADGLVLDFEVVPWDPEAPFEITEMRFIPGTTEFLLLDKNGTVRHYDLVEGEAVAIGSFDLDITFSFNDCGLLSLTFDPDFDDNGLFYVGACIDHDFSSVYRLMWDAGDYGAVVDSQALIITEGDANARNPWHNVSSIGFFSDETMWIGFGDKTVQSHGQDVGTNLSTMLRILPDRDPMGPGGYEPAPDNPFPESPDVWAYGLRAPFRVAMDDLDRLVVGDVGANSWEEVDLVDEPGLNFGWAVAEGVCDADCEGLTDPIVTWRHGANEFTADDPEALPVNRWVVWVSAFYDPPAELDRYEGLMTGRFLFGDMCSGWVRGLQLDDEGTVVYNEAAGHLENAAAWDVGPDGYLYAVASGGCVNSKFGDDPAVLYRTVLQ